MQFADDRPFSSNAQTLVLGEAVRPVAPFPCFVKAPFVAVTTEGAPKDDPCPLQPGINLWCVGHLALELPIGHGCACQVSSGESQLEIERT